MRKLDAALQAAAKGFRVFELITNGKLPRYTGWQKAATHDVITIRKYWEEFPNHNVGIATGIQPNNKYLFVLDLDFKHGVKDGHDTLSKLKIFFGPLPDTYTVKTKSGGLHFYFWSDIPLPTTAAKLGQGIDTRCVGGLVVAPGSTIDNIPYTVLKDLPIAAAPSWFERELGRASETQALPPVVSGVSQDHDVDIEKAINYLSKDAPEAIEGAGGDATTYTVAARLRDYGISPETCLDLMLTYWNEQKAFPAWDADDLQNKIYNAYRYAKNPQGLKSITQIPAFNPTDPASMPVPANAYTPPITPVTPQITPIAIAPVTTFDVKAIPRRKWLLQNIFLKGKITEIIAPPGAGKSTLTIAMALSLAANRDILNIHPTKKCKVLLWNNEDDTEELNRRLAASMQNANITFPDLTMPDNTPSLYIQSGENRLFTIASKLNVNQIVPTDLNLIIDFLIKNNIELLIIDPFAETHQANENDNAEMLKVAQMYRTIAQKANCAVCIVHHTRKPPMADNVSHAGNMDSGRGASSIAGVARVILTLYSMSKKDAKTYNIQEDRRNRYVRLDDAKANLSLISSQPRWFERTTVKLPTSDLENATEVFTDPDGSQYAIEEVGALTPVTLTPVTEVTPPPEENTVPEGFIRLLDDVLKVFPVNAKRATMRELGALLRELNSHHASHDRLLDDVREAIMLVGAERGLEVIKNRHGTYDVFRHKTDENPILSENS